MKSHSKASVRDQAFEEGTYVDFRSEEKSRKFLLKILNEFVKNMVNRSVIARAQEPSVKLE